MPFVFVVGCGRSGTTLVRSMLDSHSDLAIPGEAGIVVRLLRDAGGSPEDPGRQVIERDRLIEQLSLDRGFLRWNLPVEAVRTEIPAPTCTVGDFIRATYRAYASAQCKHRYADKTPGNVLHMPLIADGLPEARFIHVIRDGRDVVSATIDASWGPATVDEAAAYWRRRVAVGRRDGERIGADRYMEVRYEDLIEDPKREIARMCTLLEIDFEPGMLDHADSATRAIAMTDRPAEASRSAQPLTAGARDWRRERSAGEVALVELVAGAELTAFGYELAGREVGPVARIGARLRRGWHQTRTAARAMRRDRR